LQINRDDKSFVNMPNYLELESLSANLTKKNLIDRFDYLNNNQKELFSLNLDKKLFILNFNYMISLIPFLYVIFKILCIVVPLLISVAYFTLAERKILGAIQRRRGPNVIGFVGLLQPLSDGLKLFVKEAIFPSNSNKFIFKMSPVITFLVSLMGYAIIPFDKYSVLADINLGILYLFAMSSLGIYGIIMSG